MEKTETKIAELERRIQILESALSTSFKGKLDDLFVERVIFSNITTGTPPTSGTDGEYTDNNLLYQIALTGDPEDKKILNFPRQVLIYTWKGQRLAIPVYDATNIVYP